MSPPRAQQPLVAKPRRARAAGFTQLLFVLIACGAAPPACSCERPSTAVQSPKAKAAKPKQTLPKVSATEKDATASAPLELDASGIAARDAGVRDGDAARSQ